MSENIRDRILKLFRPPPLTIELAEVEEITDEIEKSLLELKDVYDLDTEEVSKSIVGYRGHKKFRVPKEEERKG